MKVKPLNTEVNRTALAEKIVGSLSAKEVYDYAVHMMATIYDNTPDVFYDDWERWNNDAE